MKEIGNTVVGRCENAIELKGSADESLSLPSETKEVSIIYFKDSISLEWQYSSESVWYSAVYCFPTGYASPLLPLIFLFFLSSQK